MIVCRECGHSNAADDVFCGSCGSYLEWVGERVEADEPEAEPAADEAVADDTRPGLIDRVKSMVGLEDQEGSPAGEPPPESTVRLDEPRRGEAEPGARAESQQAAREAVQAEAGRAAREAAEAERAARDAAEAEARARVEQQARRQAELDARAKAEAEARAAAEARAREQAQRASREEAEQAAREAAQAQAREAAEAAAREAADAEARERAEAQAREAAEAQARERAEAQARQRDEAAAKARAESTARREAEQAADRARRAAALVAKQEAAAAASPPEAEPRSDGPARPTRPVRPPPPVVPSDAATAEPPCPPGGLGAQQPTAQRRKVEPKTLQPPTRTIQPGDLVCGSCGEGNAPSRNFCRRCGHPLADATVARIPWWRRIFRRRKRVLPAGTRPGRTDRAAGGAGESRGRVAWRGVRKVGRRVLSLVVAAAALLALVGAFVPAARPWRAAVMDRVEAVYGVGRRLISPRYVNVHPVQATASSHLPSREPGLAIDRIKDFSWAEGAPGDGVGERLIVTFAEPVDIYRVGFYSGSSQEPEAFTAQPRPKDLHLVFSDGSSADVTLNDTWDFQPFEAGGKQVTEVVIRIDSVYGPAPDGACAIREVEFFTKA